MPTITRAFPLFLLAGAVFASGCGQHAGTSPGGGTAATGGKRVSVYLLPKKKGIAYFSSCNDGAQRAAKELGDVDLTYDGPTDGAAEKAASLIETWTLKGADVIAISPNDPSVLAPAMMAAKAKGVHVLTWDADGQPGTRDFFVNQATSEQIGDALVDTMVKDLGGPDKAVGKVAVVTATLTAANQNEWIKYIKARLRKYPKLELVAVKPCNEDQNVAFQVTQDLIKTYPDLKGVFGISSVAFPGAAEAVKQSGKGGQVLVTGLSTPNAMKAYVQDGTVKSVILWNTQDLGYLTVYAAEAVATGKLKSGATSLKAGRLGEKKIVGDNILLGDILIFNKDNIGKYDF